MNEKDFSELYSDAFKPLDEKTTFEVPVKAFDILTELYGGESILSQIAGVQPIDPDIFKKKDSILSLNSIETLKRFSLIDFEYWSYKEIKTGKIIYIKGQPGYGCCGHLDSLTEDQFNVAYEEYLSVKDKGK